MATSCLHISTVCAAALTCQFLMEVCLLGRSCKNKNAVSIAPNAEVKALLCITPPLSNCLIMQQKLSQCTSELNHCTAAHAGLPGATNAMTGSCVASKHCRNAASRASRNTVLPGSCLRCVTGASRACFCRRARIQGSERLRLVPGNCMLATRTALGGSGCCWMILTRAAAAQLFCHLSKGLSKATRDTCGETIATAQHGAQGPMQRDTSPGLCQCQTGIS